MFKKIFRKFKEDNTGYREHSGKVIDTGEKFSHVMAITLDPTSGYREGVARCITSRQGNVEIKGYVDYSELHLVRGTDLEHFEIGEHLEIKSANKIIAELTPPGWECIGLEDPDIWIDPETKLMHLYFTIPIKPPTGSKEKIKIHLGHAVGKDLGSLEMTEPILRDDGQNSAKEVAIAPLNKQGFRYNLVESRDRAPEGRYSIVQIAIAKNMGESWQYGEVAFHPKEHDLAWIGGHASPGPLLFKEFINLGEDKVLGILNGREADQQMPDGTIKYGMFSVGLFIYNYETGKIEWVSPKPFVQDSQAKTITFASQFILTGPGQGMLYAHVDDSFVRAYSLNAQELKKILPE